MSQAAAAGAVGVQRQTVNIWLKRYRQQGEAGLLDGRRVSGRKGQGALTADQARQLRRWIAEKTPYQLKLPFALWTSRAVRELIERRFGQRLGLSTVQLYLKRWGMTPQKARSRAPRNARPLPWLPGWSATTRRSPRPRQAQAGGYLGRRDRHLQPGPDRPQLGPERPDAGRRPDRQADLQEHDLGGLQPRPDALHAVRWRARHRSVPHLPAPADQGRRAEGLSDRR